MFVMKAALCIVATVLVSFSVLIAGSRLGDVMRDEDEVSPFHEVMPDGGEFTSVAIDGLDEMIIEAYSSETGGYVFSLDAIGYYPHMMILCGIDADGTVTGAVCTESSESLGREYTYGDEFVGVSADSVDEVSLVTGATKTTKGYRKAISVALEAFEILKER